MKAKEYFAKYDGLINSSDGSKEATDLLIEMSEEIEKIAEIRHVKNGKALLSIILEENDKWNAIVRMFENKYGISQLLRDGFKNFWFDQMPELKLMMEATKH